MLRAIKHTRFNFSNGSLLTKCKKLSTDVHPSFTDKSHPQVAKWLFGMGAMVAGMVTVGGITRITRSGLSMTDWKLQGSLPPMTPEEWDKEFERYKQFPEWKQRQSMTVEDFKGIYFWEYSHRMLGRTLGLVFLGPFTYFAARRMIPKYLYPKLAVLFGLGGAQGLVGWWMVKSGLDDNLMKSNMENNQEIRVTPHRLAAHLTMAFTTYTMLLWTGLECINPMNIKSAVTEAFTKTFSSEQVNRLRRLRQFAILNGALAFSTAVSGAFVAGNDAGRAYNTFPKMLDDRWFPSTDVLFELQPFYRNFFENTATVQMDHRILALTTLTSVWAIYLPLYLKGKSAANVAETVVKAASDGTKTVAASAKQIHYKLLPRFTQVSLTAMTHATALQVALGVATLLNYVPLSLAVAHQAGSVVVLTTATMFVHSLKYIKYLK